MPSDCLVLKVEEVYRDSDVIDHCVYILFDRRTNKYIVRGKRNEANVDYAFESFSFDCDESIDVVSLLKFIIYNSNTLTYKLHNYKNLPWTSQKITFESLENDCELSGELVCYEKFNFSCKSLRNNIRLLKNVCNNY